MSKYIALSILILVKVVYSQSGDHTLDFTTETPDVTLDWQNQTGVFWELPSLEPQFEDWFYYYDSLNHLSENATVYFKDVNLTQLTSALGVWVAFNSSLGPPEWNKPFPIIKPAPALQTYEKLEITYSIYQHASIRLYYGDELSNEIFSQASDVPLTWKTNLTDILLPEFHLELVANNTGDFVLIDKIVLIRPETPTRPPSVAPVPQTSTTMATNATTELEITTPASENSSTDSNSGNISSGSVISFNNVALYCVISVLFLVNL